MDAGGSVDESAEVWFTAPQTHKRIRRRYKMESVKPEIRLAYKYLKNKFLPFFAVLPSGSFTITRKISCTMT
jgi:hypothetical protein